MTGRAAWVDVMRSCSVLDTAQRLGLHVDTRGSSPSIRGCPACGAETRHAKSRDRRGAVGIAHGGRGWRCFQCQCGGGSIDLVACVLHGSAYRDLRDDQRRDVRTTCIELTGASGATVASASRAPRALSLEGPSAAVDVPLYPPIDEVHELWHRLCRPVIDAPHTADYLRGRRLDPQLIADLDLARAMPSKGVAVPQWAQFGGRSWRVDGYHLLIPLRDHLGEIRSVIARNILGERRRSFRGGSQIPKSVPPSGGHEVSYARRGLAMLCPLARQLIARCDRPVDDAADTPCAALGEWWPSDTDLRMVIAEGEMDYLAWASAWGDADACAPATIGIVSGSWSQDFADRVPDGSTIVIASDNDDEGERYAAKIIATFAGRSLRLERWRGQVAA